MRSKVHFKSHPIHPMLVGFPITLYFSTWIFDLLGNFYKTSLLETAFYLNILGIFFAIAAAIPGFIDFLKVVPPDSSAKNRAAKHGILNVIVLLLFGFSLFLKYNEPEASLILLIETAGIVTVSFAGFMGGTLVFRNQIGVDIRYADAGKCKEEFKEAENGRVYVAKKDELKYGQMKLIHVDKTRIVVGLNENGYAAFSDRCTHKGASLAAGALVCEIVQCPWHGSQFNIETGEIVAGPAKKNLKLYQIVEEDDDIFINMDEVIHVVDYSK